MSLNKENATIIRNHALRVWQFHFPSKDMHKVFLLLLVPILVAAAVVVCLNKQHPIILKVATGSARILSSPMTATIKVNGQIQPHARCFLMK